MLRDYATRQVYKQSVENDILPPIIARLTELNPTEKQLDNYLNMINAATEAIPLGRAALSLEERLAVKNMKDAFSFAGGDISPVVEGDDPLSWEWVRCDTPGKLLFEQSVEYLESQGFEHGDYSVYYLATDTGEEFECGHIGLSCWTEEVGIDIYDSSLANQSPTLRLSGEFEDVRKVLELLVFAIKLGEKD